MMYGVRDGSYSPAAMNAAMGGVRALLDYAKMYHKHGHVVPKVESTGRRMAG